MLRRFAFCLFASSWLFAGTSVMAQVNFTINGNITEASCTPSMTGTGVSGNVVTLPDVNLTQLDTTGKIAGSRTITFSVSNCGMSTAVSNMWVHFDSTGVTAGRINTNNPNVKFEIRDGTTGNVQVHAGGTAGVTGPGANQGTGEAFTGTFPNRAASKVYRIMYYASGVVSQAGAVTANATYTVKYY